MEKREFRLDRTIRLLPFRERSDKDGAHHPDLEVVFRINVLRIASRPSTD